MVGFRNGRPSSLYLRDFENARLVSQRVSDAAVSGLTEDEQRELNYTETKAWKRFAYCLFSNHIVEAIRQLSFAHPDLEPRLWECVRRHLLGFLQNHGEPTATPMLMELVRGQPLWAKTNLITRVLAGKDAQAGYVAIGNPWLSEPELVQGFEKKAKGHADGEMTSHA